MPQAYHVLTMHPVDIGHGCTQLRLAVDAGWYGNSNEGQVKSKAMHGLLRGIGEVPEGPQKAQKGH